RFRHEYSLDETGLLNQVKKRIPDVTTSDLKKWRDAGELQYRIIDGKVMYFRREPSNLFRFSQEAKQRARAQATDPDKAPDWKLVEHLKKVVADAEATGKSEVCPLNHRIEYSITIPAKTAGVRAGSLARIWLPYPQEYRQQK